MAKTTKSAGKGAEKTKAPAKAVKADPRGKAPKSKAEAVKVKPAADAIKAKPAATGKGKGAKPVVPAAKTVNAALAKPLKPSDQLAAIVGKGPLPRTEVVSKVWEYIREHKLQNPDNKREILVDTKLKGIFGKDKVTMFEMNKLFSAHLS